MKEVKNKGQNSQTEVHNLRLAFCWGPALLKWHPTEQARQSLAEVVMTPMMVVHLAFSVQRLNMNLHMI